MSRRVEDLGGWLLLFGSLIALGAAVFDYFWTGNGIHGTPGVLLVIITTALIVLAAAALLLWPPMPRWLRALLLFLILVDLIGTGFAGYLLEAWPVVAALALTLVGWVVHVAVHTEQRQFQGAV